MFGAKGEQITKLREQVQDLTGRIDAATTLIGQQDTELNRLRNAPFITVAQQLETEHSAIARRAATNPSTLPADYYEEAVDQVRSRLRTRAVGIAAQTLEEQQGAAIAEEIKTTEGDNIRAAAAAQYARDVEPDLREETSTRVRREIWNETLSDLRKRRPGEIEDEVRKTDGPRIKEEVIAAFERDEASEFRRRAKREAREKIGEETRERLRDRIQQEEAMEAMRLAEDEERFKVRINLIAGRARRTRKVELAHLRQGDVITVRSAKPFVDSTDEGVEEMRSLRMEIEDPKLGTAVILGDSWERGRAAETMLSLRSGARVTIGTALGESPNDGKTDKPPTAPALTYSVPMRLIHNGKDVTAPLDVARVTIAGYDQDYVLLTNPQNRRSSW